MPATLEQKEGAARTGSYFALEPSHLDKEGRLGFWPEIKGNPDNLIEELSTERALRNFGAQEAYRAKAFTHSCSFAATSHQALMGLWP